MIRIWMDSRNIPDNGPNTLTETFTNYKDAFNYLTGYIGAAPITIESLETEVWE